MTSATQSAIAGDIMNHPATAEALTGERSLLIVDDD
jgi:hypothetical protein